MFVQRYNSEKVDGVLLSWWGDGVERERERERGGTNKHIIWRAYSARIRIW